eukprot:2134596-Karenia_brevis.AAC.1
MDGGRPWYLAQKNSMRRGWRSFMHTRTPNHDDDDDDERDHDDDGGDDGDHDDENNVHGEQFCG